MRSLIIIILGLFSFFECYSLEIFRDTIGIRNYILEECKNSGINCEGPIKLINKGCDIEIPKLKKRIDTYLILKGEYSLCKSDEERLSFINRNQDNFDVLRLRINDIPKANKLFNSEEDPYLEASRNICIKRVCEYNLDNAEDAIRESFEELMTKIKLGKKVYWKELIKVGEYWGIPEDKMNDLAKKYGFYKSKSGLLKYRKN